MKKFTPFEVTIMGLFAGVVVAMYIVYLSSTGGSVGVVLASVSLLFLLPVFKVSSSLVGTFLLVVAVYTLFGLIAGLLIKKNTKVGYLIIFLILALIVSVVIDQSKKVATSSDPSYEVVQPLYVRTKVVEKPLEQYFGNEARGDLNGDGKDDIAFFVSRDDEDRGVLYYLIASLANEKGYTGTNLIFLGNKVKPQNLEVVEGSIIVNYLDLSDKNSTTTQKMYFKVDGGVLKTATTTERGN